MTNSLILTTIHNFQDSEQLQETEDDMQCPSDTTNAIDMSCKATGWLDETASRRHVHRA